MEGRPPSMAPEPLGGETMEDGDTMEVQRCQLCGRNFQGTAQLRAHLKGNRHKRMVAR